MTIKVAKEKLTNQLQEQLQLAKMIIVIDYRGLDVKQITKLRRKLGEVTVDFRVVKNTLIQRAAKQANLESLNQFFQGPSAVALCYDDKLAGVGVLAAFAKENPRLEIKGGIVAGKIVTKEETGYLATIPPREVLLAQLLCGIQAPIQQLFLVLQTPITAFLLTLKAISDAKQKQ